MFARIRIIHSGRDNREGRHLEKRRMENFAPKTHPEESKKSYETSSKHGWVE